MAVSSWMLRSRTLRSGRFDRSTYLFTIFIQYYLINDTFIFPLGRRENDEDDVKLDLTKGTALMRLLSCVTKLM